ncbi:PLDc N-terminal domain-containing protein [uncultured Dokdonia sp.]|uniref:PLDc N-terminal domain-containing protein n=1 Tax=uncultured Dokdonia sp. TaxID=575653 RepID=UPI003450A822
MSNIISSILLLAVLSFMIYAVYTLFKNSKINQNNKIIWVVIIIMMPLIGAILFLIMNKNKK